MSLVVPMWNEHENYTALRSAFREAARQGVEIVIVSNGSDASFRDLVNQDTEWVHLVILEVNQGFGGAVQAGLSAARGEWAGWMPGNGKVDPTEALAVCRQEILRLNGRAAVIKARRTGRRMAATVKTFLAGAVQSAMMRTSMFDTGGTPTFLHRSLIPHFLSGPRDYVFESFTLWQARRLGVVILRPSITYRERVHGRSHWQSGLGAELGLMWSIAKASRSW